jgi:hypothetical protein
MAARKTSQASKSTGTKRGASKTARKSGARRSGGDRAGAPFKRILNCLPSPGQEQDWRFENAKDAGVLRAAAAVPATRDLREDWWAIGDQGATGSCVGWASADSVLRWHFVKANLLDKREPLSTRFQWMAAKETDEFTSRPTSFIEEDGTSLKAALDVARRFGAVPENVLPFALGPLGQLYQGATATFYAIAAQRKIAGYFNLGSNLTQWRTWLATKGPILTRLDVDDTWDNATATQGKLERYLANTARGGHAVAIVGYTPGRFIVRNSWGTAWGDKGFAYASLAYAQRAFTEAYGVSV